MISTFQALAVALLALLPGASYTFAVERVVGSFGVQQSDRLVRFLAASVTFDGLLAGPAYAFYRREIVDGRLRSGHANIAVVELVGIAYVIIPLLVGVGAGLGSRRGWRPLEWIGGTTVEPRAWDYVWQRRGLTGVVRLRLKSGRWLAGVYGTTEAGTRSFAAGYPEDQDLFLSRQLKVDPDTGAFELDDDGAPAPMEAESGLLLRWQEIEYIDLQEG